VELGLSEELGVRLALLPVLEVVLVELVEAEPVFVEQVLFGKH